MPVPAEALSPRPLLRDDVYLRLRDAIVAGTLEPGEQLRDQELAAWLGVSRTPVREALLRLQETGLVTSRPGRSTTVTPVDQTGLRDARAVVAAMHELAVREAVPRLTDADLDRMRAANRRFASALRRGDLEAALAADDEFHGVPVLVSGNGALAAVLDQFTPALRRAELLRFASHTGRGSVEQHRRVIDLCAARDVPGAAAVAAEIWRSLELPSRPSPD